MKENSLTVSETEIPDVNVKNCINDTSTLPMSGKENEAKNEQGNVLDVFIINLIS